MRKDDFDSYIINNKEGYSEIYAPGGGLCSWYLCNYKKKYYFVYNLFDSSDYSARVTDIDEIIDLIRSGFIQISTDNKNFTYVMFDELYPTLLNSKKINS